MRQGRIKITRYYTTLRPEETRDVVERLADLIVDFVKRDGRTGKKKKRQ